MALDFEPNTDFTSDFASDLAPHRPRTAPRLVPPPEPTQGPIVDQAPLARPATPIRFDRAFDHQPAPPREADRPKSKWQALLHRYDVNSLDNRDPGLIRRVIDVVEKVIAPYHRAEVAGIERIPQGAALFVGNHSGGVMTMDSFVFGAAVHRAHGFAGLPYVLTHDFALRMPGLHQLFSALGGVRATRDNARRLFEAGHKVLVYPGGSDEALRPFRDRNKIRFHEHRGYIRTALLHDVPIVPVVGQGSHATFIVLDDAKWFARLLGVDRLLRIKSWGVTLSVPWGLTLFPPPLYVPLPAKIRMEVMEPIQFSRSGAAAADDEAYVSECAQLVEERMQGTLDRLAAQR